MFNRYVTRQMRACASLALFAVCMSNTMLADARTVTNQAAASFARAPGLDPETEQANVVIATLPIRDTTVSFFHDANLAKAIRTTTFNTPVFLAAVADACNKDSAAVDSVTIRLTNPSTGDHESYTAVETGPDTGEFKVPAQTWAVNKTVASESDGIIDAVPNDDVSVILDDCQGSSAANRLLIDPAGIVFDSRTNQPIAGAAVTLIDVTGSGNGGRPGGEAVVFDFDGVTSHPATMITGADGEYQFPVVQPSVYRLVVVPPGDYTFPSTNTVSSTWRGRGLQAEGSYGKDFSVDATTGAVMFDVPLDSSPTGLFAQKLVSRNVVEMAESLEYTVIVRNVSGLTLQDITVRDDLPRGFTYIKNTTKLDGAKIADPTQDSPLSMTFAVGSLNDAESHTLTYRVTVSNGATQGNNVNRAQAFSRIPAMKQSNVATVNVKVEGGVFDSDAYILGKIFADCNRNHVQDPGEPGVAGARLYLEDGSFVISDSEGKYSFYAVHPRTHTLKVDATTLPQGSKLEPLTHRNGFDGGSLFIDAKRGELHRADFALDRCGPGLIDELKRRSLISEGKGDQLVREASAELKTESVTTAIGDTRALPASGVIGEQLRAQVAAELARLQTAQPQTPKPLPEIAPSLNDQLDFLDAKDGDVARSSRITVRVKGRAHARIDLTVNGEKMDEKSVGSRTIVEATQVEAREYIGLPLQPGTNVLELTQYDNFGNVRGTRKITIRAPGELERILVTPPLEATAADSDGQAKVHIELLDAHGLRIAGRTPVTLEASLGEWQVSDTDPNEPGVQTLIEDGAADFALAAPLTPGDSRVRVTSARVAGEGTVSFVPRLRPMIATGLVEGTLNLRKLDAHSPVRNDDGGFEDALSSVTWADTKNDSGARAAVFAKGEIADRYLLTLGYDSDKDTSDPLFRDIQPDKFYPTFGDASIKGFDAQSTGHLYARVDKDKSYLLYGDFTTQAISQNARQLGAYNRGLNGVKDRYETERVILETFASHDSSRQVVQEVPANGTSGPFALDAVNATQNSERVEILTRDRNQPGIVLDTQVLARFVDYQIDEFTGSLILRAPVPSVDANLNPSSIRVTYEVDAGGPEFWVAGLDSQFKLSERVSVGGSFVDDADPLNTTRISSGNMTLQLTSRLQLLSEVAHSDRELTGTGWGRRVELRQDGEKLKLRAYAGRADADFDNPSSTLTQSREEDAVRAAYSLNERTRLLGEALNTEDTVTGANRRGGLLGVERSFEGNVKVEAGVRQVHDEPPTGSTLADSDTTSLRAKVTTPLPGKPEAQVYGEYEQDVKESDKQMAALGGEYQFQNRSRLYLRHEFITSLTGPYDLNDATRRNTTVFGMDTRYLQDDRIFSEYRVGDAFDGRSTQAAVGLRNKFQLAEGLRLNTTLERTDTLRGVGEGQAAAAAAAVEYTRNPLWKGTARLEGRTSDTTSSYFSTLGLARKLSEEWTFLGRNALAISEYKSSTTPQPDDLRERLQLGVAYRDDAVNRINGLGRYEMKHEEGATADNGTRDVQMISGHLDFAPTNIWIFTGQYAAKYAMENAEGVKTYTNAQLFGGRLTRDFGKRWDAGIAVRELVSAGFRNRQSATGFEVGYIVLQNLWVSVGYNLTGFYDRDLSEGNYTNQGLYARLRFKFDESLLGERWAHEGTASP